MVSALNGRMGSFASPQRWWSPPAYWLRSFTLCRVCSNLVMYYHTQNNRRVRRFDLKKVDFVARRDLVRLPLDKKSQDCADVTLRP